MNGGAVPLLVEQLVLLGSQFLLKRESKIHKGKSKKMLPNIGISDSSPPPHLLDFRSHSLRNSKSDSTVFHPALFLPFLHAILSILFAHSWVYILPFFPLRNCFLTPLQLITRWLLKKCYIVSGFREVTLSKKTIKVSFIYLDNKGNLDPEGQILYHQSKLLEENKEDMALFFLFYACVYSRNVLP